MASKDVLKRLETLTVAEITKRKGKRMYKTPVGLQVTRDQLKEFLSDFKRVKASQIPKQAGYIDIIDLGEHGTLLVGKLGGREVPTPPRDLDDGWPIDAYKTLILLSDGPCHLEITMCGIHVMGSKCVGNCGAQNLPRTIGGSLVRRCAGLIPVGNTSRVYCGCFFLPR